MRATLGEGNTPLIESVQIGRVFGLKSLFFKLESCNPSGSYKDRFIAGEISRLLRVGATACVATSSGNTGSALAAYSARYGLKCAIVVNEHVPAGKLEQMQAHRAQVFRVPGFTVSPSITRNVYSCLSLISKQYGMPLVVSAYAFNPEGMSEVETIASEITRQISTAVDHVFVPVGGGGLFTAVCRGFLPHPLPRPRIHAVQPSGCSTVVSAFERGDNDIRPVESTTRISGLSVPFDIDASIALEHLRQSGGRGFAVEDAEVFQAQYELLSREGIFCEPAGAASLAGLIRGLRHGVVSRDQNVVCLVTGHGFKDPDSVRQAGTPYPPVWVEAGQLKEKLLQMAM
jgi:threonine synthase